MRMYNRFLVLFLCFFAIILCPCRLSAQEYEPATVIVIKRAPLWYNQSFKKQSNIYSYANALSIVPAYNGPVYSDIDGIKNYLCWIDIDGMIYAIQSELLAPVRANDNFPDNWILNLNDGNRKRWVITYYLDVFSSQKRDTLLRYENDWIELCTEAYNQGADYGPGADWTEVAIVRESLFFFPHLFPLGLLHQ